MRLFNLTILIFLDMQSTGFRKNERKKFHITLGVAIKLFWELIQSVASTLFLRTPNQSLSPHLLFLGLPTENHPAIDL